MFRLIQILRSLQVRPWLWVAGLICLPILLLSLYQEQQRVSEAVAQRNQSQGVVGYLDGLRGDIKPGQAIQVVGWAVDLRPNASIQRVEVHIDNKVVGVARLGLPRPDVATVLQRKDRPNGGWEANFALPQLPPGSHIVSAVTFDTQNNPTPLRPEITIRVE